MPIDTVTIYHGYPNGHLDVKPDSITVQQYHRVYWIIDPSSNVASIENIDLKKGKQIFIGGPTRKGNGWIGRAMFSTKPDKPYEYYITWAEKGKPGIPHKYDPKIAVKPGFGILLILVISIFILGLLSVGVRKLFSTRK